MTDENKYGHWICPWEFIPDEWIGFVYKITHINSGRSYIGKKAFNFNIRKKVKNRKNRKRTIKASNWKTYTGSSKMLNEDIVKFGKDKFKFEILSLHESKGTLAYTEVETLVMKNVLRAKLADGSKAFYNGLIPPCKFTPSDETDREREYKI